MTEMIERVAKALYILDGDNIWEQAHEGLRGACRKEARAAIEAMREPIDSMCDAGTEAIVTEIIKDGHWTRGQNADVDLTRRHGRIFWRGMIDAALGTKTK